MSRSDSELLAIVAIGAIGYGIYKGVSAGAASAVPKIEVPKLELPSLSIPQVALPKLDAPDLDMLSLLFAPLAAGKALFDSVTAQGIKKEVVSLPAGVPSVVKNAQTMIGLADIAIAQKNQETAKTEAYYQIMGATPLSNPLIAAAQGQKIASQSSPSIIQPTPKPTPPSYTVTPPSTVSAGVGMAYSGMNRVDYPGGTFWGEKGTSVTYKGVTYKA